MSNSLHHVNHLNQIETAVSTSFNFSTCAVEILNQAIQAKSTRRVNFFGDPDTQSLRQCLLAFENSFLGVSRNMMQQITQEKNGMSTHEFSLK